jgi:hypothetical protein
MADSNKKILPSKVPHPTSLQARSRTDRHPPKALYSANRKPITQTSVFANQLSPEKIAPPTFLSLPDTCVFAGYNSIALFHF